MLEKVSSDLLQETLETLKSTKGFVLEQAPDIVQQFYKWRVAEHIFYVILALIISVVMIRLACKYWECLLDDGNPGRNSGISCPPRPSAGWLEVSGNRERIYFSGKELGVETIAMSESN